ncbi:kinase-like protein [Lentithecium fluviatile CBS 122367]|uniref:Kinase-like protein n=1 Tax=Lentithecium fluviatile CBS 122367 TaxID=1168545 RepID=A0A6G1JKL4_9PLEO|nr:kinase-like protein [Lentithecium fluviatile CBS 122367]
MSMFRRPGDSSSSEDESSHVLEESSASAEDASLSRINTMDSAQSAPVASGSSGLQVAPAVPLPRSKTTDHMRDLVLHSLLEDKATREAASHLGKDQSDPEVQKLAKETYKGLAQQLSGNYIDMYASDEMKDKRAAAKEGINNATRLHLTSLSAAANASATAAIASSSQALVSRSILGLPGDQSFCGLQHPIPMFLQGHPGLHTDRYAREYEELEVVGKGGYGKVFKVKHKLDNSFYAVKKIVVSPVKMQKIQERGVQEMESLLEEVRSLARFDHVNIVRYHSAWFEFSTLSADAPMPSTATVFGPERLLRNASGPSFSASEAHQLHPSFDNLALFEQPSHYSGADIVFETSDTVAKAQEPRSGADIVFEASDTGAGSKSEAEVASPHERTSRRTDRRGSEATIGTISSARSHMSAVEEAVDEDEEDIEMIPRSHAPTLEESESMISNSDMPHQLISARPTSGPVLTLNVQMSLYDTNLALFLSETHSPPSHCFHPCISLELLASIISGVQYLHSRSVVHRDLKPANIFLSLSNDRLPPAGSVNLSSCHPCPARECLHLTPRIGDFGLVAALGESCLTESAKPVGTEFYRPPAGGRISEKLDVFALGVVAFEMLQRFGTRMERVDALTRLRRGEFPADFATHIGVAGERVQGLLGGMVGGSEEESWGCEQVKKEIEGIVRELRGMGE